MKNKFTAFSLLILFFVACSSGESAETQLSSLEKEKLQNQVTELQKELSKSQDTQTQSTQNQVTKQTGPNWGKYVVPGTKITGEICDDGTEWFTISLEDVSTNNLGHKVALKN